MPSFIFYCTDKTNLSQTINDLRDKTPPELIEELIVCDDGGGVDLDDVTILKTENVGRAKAWNAAAKQAKSKVLIFLRQTTKFGKDWLEPLLKNLDEKTIVSPVIHSLDLNLWAIDRLRWRRFGIHWDMSIHNRRYIGGNKSPVASSYCITIEKARFDEIGGFDNGMKAGPGEDIDISIKNWLFGGQVLVVDDSKIAAFVEQESGKSAVNMTRLVERWMPKYSTYFYQSRSINPNNIKPGRLDTFKTERDINWWLQNIQPELLNVFSLKNVATGKTVAVIGNGPSLDYIKPSDIERHDIIIGIDYVGELYRCDYLVTSSAQVVLELRDKYPAKRFVVAFALFQGVAGQYVAAAELIPDSIQFDQYEFGMIGETVNPPFCNFESSVLTAVNFALFLNPRSITLFGCDNRIISGRSHTSKISYYRDGQIWPDTEATQKRLALYEGGLIQLGKMAQSANIPLLRVAHI